MAISIVSIASTSRMPIMFMYKMFSGSSLMFADSQDPIVLLISGINMTAIKHALQRDIFTPNDERLLSIVNVCKAGKKKKNCFLCATGRTQTQSDPAYPCPDHISKRLSIILPYQFCLLSSVTTERPVQVKVVKVKKSDKGDFYKRQMAWELRDLTEVDAKDATKVRGHMWNFININSDMK